MSTPLAALLGRKTEGLPPPEPVEFRSLVLPRSPNTCLAAPAGTSQGATVEALRPAWASWIPIFCPCEWAKSTTRCSGAVWLSCQSPESWGEMRPLGVTAIASIMVKAAPRTAKAPRCARCQSVRCPSSALYWHMGATANRFGSVMPRICSGRNSVGAAAGSCAEPAGGSWAGV